LLVVCAENGFARLGQFSQAIVFRHLLKAFTLKAFTLTAGSAVYGVHLTVLRGRRLVPDALQIATDHVAGDLQSGLAGIVVHHHIAAELVLSQDVDAVVIATDAHVVGYRVVAEVAATSVVVAGEIPAYRGGHDLHNIVDIEMAAAADVDVAADRRGTAENFHPSAAVGVEVTSKGGAVSDLDIASHGYISGSAESALRHDERSVDGSANHGRT